MQTVSDRHPTREEGHMGSQEKHVNKTVMVLHVE